MQCQNIIDVLEQHSPTSCALEWDNVGLLAGRRDKTVKKLLIALDATDAVIEEAVRGGVDMLLTHHPLIYSARKTINTDDVIGRRLVKLLRNDISYYAMHTSFDVRGMAQLSERKLKLSDTFVLEQTGINEAGEAEGIGRCGYLPEPMTLEMLAEYVKKCFELDHVRVCGDLKQNICLVAISGGSGKSMVSAALKKGVQVLISGDFDHHTVLDAVADGLCIIDAGHHGTEKMFVPYMEQYVKQHCKEIEVMSMVEAAPFRVL